MAQRFQPPGTPPPRGEPPNRESPNGEPPTGLQKAQALLRELVMGVKPAGDADLPGAIRALSAGRLTRAEFLRRFGHRGSQEMELARPRWQEEPAAVDALASTPFSPAPTASGAAPTSAAATNTLTQTWDRVAAELRLLPNQRTILEAELQTVHTYLALRETGKHHLLRGYALIRQTLVELDRRFDLDGGIFFLVPTELPRLLDIGPETPGVADELRTLVARRRQRRDIALSLPVPQVLFSDDLEAIGRAVDVAGADILQGVPLSAGIVEGPAWVLLETAGAVAPAEPYILVCPSTDPAWVPLLAAPGAWSWKRAASFPMERSWPAISACPRWPASPTCSAVSKPASACASTAPPARSPSCLDLQ